MTIKSSALILFPILFTACANMNSANPERSTASVSTAHWVDQSSIPWPQKFSVQCGDLGHKVPYDPTDTGGNIVHLDVKGTATKTDPGTGYWSDGIAYSLNLTISDSKLTGTQNPLTVSFFCPFGGAHHPMEGGNYNLGTMNCQGDLITLASQPGFNMFKASLEIPTQELITPKAETQGSITVRLEQTITDGNMQSLRFTDYTRELTCQYLP